VGGWRSGRHRRQRRAWKATHCGCVYKPPPSQPKAARGRPRTPNTRACPKNRQMQLGAPKRGAGAGGGRLLPQKKPGFWGRAGKALNPLQWFSGGDLSVDTGERSGGGWGVDEAAGDATGLGRGGGREVWDGRMAGGCRSLLAGTRPRRPHSGCRPGWKAKPTKTATKAPADAQTGPAPNL
jgi:hypothetical protein